MITGLPQANETVASYRVSAVDNQQKESTLSNTVDARVEGEPLEKATANTGDEKELVVQSYQLFQNYPNPFNPETRIRFQLPVEGHVTILVYDISGAQVATLVDRYYEAGSFQVRFDAAHLSSGIYLYRIESGEFSQVRKMMLLK